MKGAQTGDGIVVLELQGCRCCSTYRLYKVRRRPARGRTEVAQVDTEVATSGRPTEFVRG